MPRPSLLKFGEILIQVNAKCSVPPFPLSKKEEDKTWFKILSRTFMEQPEGGELPVSFQIERALDISQITEEERIAQELQTLSK